MPFRETGAMEERIAMLREHDTGASSVSALCARYGVSRETFYVWKRRRASGDPRWFEDRSRAVHRCPHATDVWQVADIVAQRQRRPDEGPKKLRAVLCQSKDKVRWPSASTIGAILVREGLMPPPRGRERVRPGAVIAPPEMVANAEWAIDFKGWFRARDGRRCDPLTLTDTASRYLLALRICDPTYVDVRSALERAFCEMGLPSAIRSDNGAPFGSTGAGGLSRLSVWWLRLGITPHYIRPGKPQDNGRHERMHRTLKDATARVPAATLIEQQARFDAFRHYYNDERPHEALGQVPPAMRWQPSPRPFPNRLDDPWYDPDHEVRRVRTTGTIKWRGEEVFVGEALDGELVGLQALETGGHLVRFCGRELGVIDVDGGFLRFAAPRARLRAPPEPTVDSGTQQE
jgi:transposase InsO family protein